ncbi:MAG: amidohydrolase [Candidatus Dormibacteraeota bacterium]|nr:amidohydrolase [Candidatus Dormibacteraeota bacterium]
MIDDHVHPFPLAFEPLELSRFTLDVEPGEAAEQRRVTLDRTRVVSEMTRVRLARFLDCDVEDAVAARDRRAREDWPGHVRALFSDAGTTGMLMDAGWQGLPPGGAERYADVSGVPVWELVRLETLVDRLMGEGMSVTEILSAVDAYMEQAVRDGAVGFKTILAYRTGLAVDVTADRDRAERELAADRAGGVAVRRSGKGLRDLVFLRTLERCADLRRPLQVHTGFGDSEIRLAEADPLLLDEALRTPAAAAVDVVLIHGSFPWHEQAAYLAAVRPRVWTELSLSNLFSPATTADRLLRLLDMAPAARITLGSDGHGPPESHWLGMLVLRDAWQEVRTRMQNLVTQRWLDKTAHAIFEGNARNLYGLGER